MHEISEGKIAKYPVYCTNTLKQMGKFESPITQHYTKCVFMADV